jgi:branched-chain amino acid transport system permease protein
MKKQAISWPVATPRGSSFRGRQFLPWFAIVVGAIALLPVLENRYYLNVATNFAILYLLSAALGLLIGFSDQVSLAQGAIYGIGAYTAAIAEVKYGVPQPIALVLAVISAAAVGFIVSLPLTRLRRHFLAMATLALQLIVTQLLEELKDITGGSVGFIGIQPLRIGGQEIPEIGYFYLVLFSCLVVYWLLSNFTRHRSGRATWAVKADETMARSLGIQPGRQRIRVFVFASAITGLAGFWFAHLALFLSPVSFSLGTSINLLAVVVIGGSGSLAGPILGAGIFYLSQQFLAGFPEYQAMLFGAVLVLVMVYLPEGVTRFIEKRLIRRRETAGQVDFYGADRRTRHLPDFVIQATAGDPPNAAGDSSGAVLHVDGVYKSFGGLQVLSDITVHVKESGTVTSIIGPNGAGKTTLFNLITGVELPDQGRIRLFSQNVVGWNPELVTQLGVARTFQVPRLALDRTCLENVLVGMHRHVPTALWEEFLALPSVSAQERRAEARAMEILAFLGMEQVAGVRANALPFGARKLLELARALASSPRLLMLDEPAAGLNEEEIAWLAAVLKDLAKAHGMTILLVDHRMDLVMTISNHVVVLDAGQVLYQDTAERVMVNDRVIEAYLGKVVMAR